MGVSTFRRLHENYAQQKAAAAASSAPPAAAAAPTPEGKPSESARSAQAEDMRQGGQQRHKRG